MGEIVVYVVKGDVVVMEGMEKGCEVVVGCGVVEKGLCGF